MITHVKELFEELSRFSPNARLYYPVRVDGISPSCECELSTEGHDLETENIKLDNEDLKEDITHLESQLRDYEFALINIRQVLKKYLITEAQQALDEINELIEGVL